MYSIDDALATSGWITDLERSDCGRLQPCYRYLRRSDGLPNLEDLLRADSSPILRVKLFSPEGAFSWYIAAYDSKHRLAWGAVDNGLEFTTGAISMSELISVRTPKLGLPIERDLHFRPTRMAVVAASWLVRGARSSKP